MSQPLTVTYEGATLFEDVVDRTFATLAATLTEREWRPDEES